MSADAVRLTLPQSSSRLRSLSFFRRADRSFEMPVAPTLSTTELIAPGRWMPTRHADPELRKVLGVIQTHLSETRRLLAIPKAAGGTSRTSAVEELTALAQQDPARLTIDGAWELAGALKRLNLRLGDEAFVGSRLEYERARAGSAGQWHGWNTHFDAAELVELLDAYRTRRPTQAEHARAVDKLTSLYLLREEAGRDRRARAALKAQTLTRLAPGLLIALAGLGIAVNYATKGNFQQTILLTVCAGALGSTLSGVFKVRDQLVQLDELRGFWPALRLQPMIGACAGLIVFLILDSQAIQLGSASSGTWSGRGLLAFAAGFSEPFFLGIVQRVAHVPDKQTADAKATK